MSIEIRPMGLRREVDTNPKGSLTLLVPSNEDQFSAEHALAAERLEEALNYYRFKPYQEAVNLNRLLANQDLGPDFSSGEVAFSPFSEAPFLDIGVNAYITYPLVGEPGKEKAKPTPVFVLPAFNARKLQEMQESGVEFEALQPFVDLGRGGVAVNFPAMFGPKAPGQPESRGLISMIMERKNDPQDPILVVGRRDVLEKGLQGINKPFVPVKFSQEQYDSICTNLNRADELYGGQRIKPPENMVSDHPNVKSVEVATQNGNFYNYIAIGMEDGSKLGYNINKALPIEIDGKKVMNEGSMFSVLNVDSNNEPLILVVSQRRAHGLTGKIETPRGFAAVDTLKKARFTELNEETGLDPNEVAKHIVHSTSCTQDPLRENVIARLDIIKLSPDMRIDMDKLAGEVKAKNRPAGPIEDITPHWMRLKDVVEGVAKGTFVRDAHTAEAVIQTLVHFNAIQISPWAKELSVVVELVQDYRTGKERIIVPRSNSSLMEKRLDGGYNGNSGAYRAENFVGVASSPDYLPVGSYMVTNFYDLWEAACDGRLDIVSTTAIFKYIMQKDLANIHYDMIYSDKVSR